MRMQETAKIALAHSASCRLAIGDNTSVGGASTCAERARGAELGKEGCGSGTSCGQGTLLNLLQGRQAPAVISPEELQESALVRNLNSLADGKRFSSFC